ncbi:hypothetical protein AKJ61_02840 [candidate division MSBL1 archaeon SCGC-AAA259B11]|uniref:Translation initiation factor 6 n=1 Tax=candidate division MSBL1 archaeon SCGC-AAA259B11 TaxID=1698260 RepID=A0A133U5I3_9EURY|nr:hypothetical protein AKJ61_02840 [candidate division MSBL1 archaeon SCGC-AAA259B11]
MSVVRLNFSDMPYLGAFALATDNFLAVPSRFGKIPKKSSEALKVPISKTLISQSTLIGILSAGNSKGVIVPDHIDTDEEILEETLETEVTRVPGKSIALGNQVLVNDEGAIVNPDLPDESIDVIRKTLGVPVKRSTIAGLKNVGASGVATNRGVLLHTDINEGELEIVEEVLKVPADIGTASSGVKYVGTCIVANSYGALIGENTTGPELGRIENTLGFT